MTLVVAAASAFVAAFAAGVALTLAIHWKQRTRAAITARDHAKLRLAGLENLMVDLLATAQEEINRRRRGGRDDQAAAIRARQIAEEIVHQRPESAPDFVKRVFAETLPVPLPPAPLPPGPKGGP